MRVKKQMQLLGLLNPAETPELKSAVTAIGNANTEAEIADILNGFTVKFIKTLANYESIWNINGLKKSQLVAKISRVIAARFNAINRRNIFRDYSPIDKVYLMRTQGITPNYIWDRANWDKDNPDNSDPKYSACTYRLPNDDSQPELPATADDDSQPAAVASTESETTAQPEALYMDDSYSDAPGDNSCPDMDIPECHEAETIPTDNNPLHHLKPCPNCRSTHIPFLKRCDDNNFSTATRRFNGGIARQHIYYRLKCRDCGHEVKATIYRTGLGRFVIPHQNDADVKNEVCQAWNKQYDDNPGITIVPSDEIEKPDYTVYPVPIIDKCPHVTVPACYIPENHNSAAAIVPYADFALIRNFFRLIAIYLRLWFAMHITHDNAPIRSHVFAPWLIELADYAPGDPNYISPLIYKWQRKKFSEKLKLCRSQIATCKTREEIIACLQNVSSESIRLLCVADRVLGKFVRIHANSECERKLAYAQRYADKIIQRREKAMTINAEMKDITAPHVKLKKKYTVNSSPRIEVSPAPASDLEHKLIETKDLHFSERRKALDHNTAVITSCMFQEAVFSMLMSISAKAVLQLGKHMRLFIATPKGSKKIIAELFAKRLIDSRNTRPNTRINSANISANNSASVPDGVKFFVGAKRQICFKFEQ